MTNLGEDMEKILAVFKKGIELESFGIKFYREAADEVTDPKGRQTLQFLANEERDHWSFIVDLKHSFESGNKSSAKKIINKRSETKAHSTVFPKMEDFSEKIAESKGDEKILEEAEDIEKRSIEFYTSAMADVKDLDYRDIFNILIREENGHLQLVQQMRDYMTLHGVWSGLEDYFANE